MFDDAVGRCDVSGSGTKGGSSQLSPLLQGLLETVRHAVSVALQADEGVLEHTLRSSISGGVHYKDTAGATSIEATRRQYTRLAGRRKKHTRRQMENMLVNTNFDFPAIDPDRYSIYIGLVFALAVVYKLINKFEQKAEQVNLMYLLQRLRGGDDSCFRELSREDLRGFLGDQLCVVFEKKWHRFDALCQRFDPDKKGLIHHTHLQRSFRWLCPLAEPQGDLFDGQVAIQALLSMVALQVLSYKLELNVLFRKILIQHKSIVPSFENFIDQKSVFPSRPPHDARFSNDSLLIADFLFVLSSQYLGWECDRSQFVANVNRRSGKSWQLPGNFVTGTTRSVSSKHAASGHRDRDVGLLLQGNTHLLQGVQFTLLNLRAVCDDCAKGLLLYDYSHLATGMTSAGCMHCYLGD